MKDYFDATTVSLPIQVKFLNFSCITSCGRLTHSACTILHFLLYSQSWRLSYDAKLVITSDRARSKILDLLSGTIGKTKNTYHRPKGIVHLNLLRHPSFKDIVTFIISLWLGNRTHQPIQRWSIFFPLNENMERKWIRYSQLVNQYTCLINYNVPTLNWHAPTSIAVTMSKSTRAITTISKTNGK